MKQQIHTLRTVTQNVPVKPYKDSRFVWKCRACSATIPDWKPLVHVLCQFCGEVMDYTPVRHTKGNGQ